jgi:hypothetical protein
VAQFPNRRKIPIIDHGNSQFQADVARVLALLSALPNRYAEFVANLPKAEYLPGDPRFANPNVVAYSSGIFRWDSSQYHNGFAGFLKTCLHEARHNMPGGLYDAKYGNRQDIEDLCDAYAYGVIDELRAIYPDLDPYIIPARPIASAPVSGWKWESAPLSVATAWQRVGTPTSPYFRHMVDMPSPWLKGYSA